MAFYTPKTTAAKSIFKALSLVLIVLILVVVRRNLCMTPQDLALRCISGNHGLNNWDPMEVCALLTFLTALLGLSYAGEGVLDIVVAAWDKQAQGGKDNQDDQGGASGLSTGAIVGIVAGVVVLIAAGIATALWTGEADEVVGGKIEEQIGIGANEAGRAVKAAVKDARAGLDIMNVREGVNF